MPPRKPAREFVNPFSEAFLDKWQLWKDYRWEQHKFKYKGVISEQARLMSLVTLSGGSEEKAVAIIMQSIENGWSGFWPLPEKLIHNGNKQQSATETRKDLGGVLSGRNYERRGS